MKYQDKTLIVTTSEPSSKGVFWFERYFGRIYDTINRAKNVELFEFDIMQIDAPVSIDTRLDSDGDRKIDWTWYYNHITKFAIEGNYTEICLHFNEEERDQWNLAKNIGGVFENDDDFIHEYYIIADRGDYARRYDKGFSPNVTEFERRFLHEKLHGYTNQTDKKKTKYLVNGKTYDITHYHDYVLDNVHQGYELIDWGPTMEARAQKSGNSDVQNMIAAILKMVQYIQSLIDSRGAYIIDKELFIHNTSQGFMRPNSAYQSGVHNGYDVACPVGTKVIAPFDCEVYRVFENHASMGNAAYLRFTTADGISWEMRVLHLNEVPVVGHYKKGTEIGRTGNTGMSTGPHLHIDVWRVPIDTNLIKSRDGVETYLVDPYAFTLWYVDGVGTPPRT